MHASSYCGGPYRQAADRQVGTAVSEASGNEW